MNDVSPTMEVLRGDEAYVARAARTPLFGQLSGPVSVSSRFRAVVDEFNVPEGHTPAGFRVVTDRQLDGSVTLDLVRDIGMDSDNRPRPTPLLFSVDSVNPYEVAPWSALVANLTCNPGIVYDLFLNNPSANVDRQFETLEDVLAEIASILGPGCDISVELHNPFDTDLARILEEVERYESIVSKHRLVVKIPHTGPVSAGSVRHLLEGDQRHPVRFDSGRLVDHLRGHQLALELESRGYRVNFTLMFEPYQTPLALQARPYFINAFIRNRLVATRTLTGLLAAYDATRDRDFVVQLRTWMVANDFLAPADADLDLLTVLEMARSHVRRRDSGPGNDGLDSVRQSLQWLAASNLESSRLILCSMDGDDMFPDITRMLLEPENRELHHRILITTDPAYLARWTSAPQVVSYQRRFMLAAAAVNAADHVRDAG